MADHTELSSAEAADRLALRELFDAYAQCADRRDAEGQKALFTDDCYSSYARGTEFLMGYYAILDRGPNGRDEDGEMWLRRHDEYDA